ncbi:MAG: hypothetical protein M1834_009321 [Cirrosporium novae-zelandiae]|nr:MAG: hypothetical protein M1834_009321 [Cirrosporium novae-zelandiae]
MDDISDQRSRRLDISQLIEESINAHTPAIQKINDTIWSNPEVAWHERTAHDTICDYFDSLGSDYSVHRHAYGIETSFLIQATTLDSSIQSNRTRTIVFNAEYDALPDMVLIPNTDPPQYKPAHACGHNLIASASIAAFIACWQALKETTFQGTVRLLGTPAEESGGGKIKLLEAGAYNNVDACMMVHPGPLTSDKNLRAVSFTTSLASQRVTADFKGLASHAGFAPWKGKNALDALVTSYAAISALRQQLHPSLRVSGIITNGGTVANVIPDHTEAEYSIRAESRKELEDLLEKIIHCFEAGEQAANCTVDVDDTRPAYWEMISNKCLCHDFTQRMNEFGVDTVYDLPELTNDAGNVSHFIPAMQAGFFIDSGDAINHMPAFADAAGTMDAFERALDCGKGLAAMGFDVLTDAVKVAQVKDSYMLDISAKAAAVAQNYGKEVPTQKQIDNLLASPPSLFEPLLKNLEMGREQVIGALMAVDAFFNPKRGLL